MTPEPSRLKLSPEQPDAVVEEVAQVLEPGAGGPDPWWQAGLEEQLGE
jgi:hypothetical protein